MEDERFQGLNYLIQYRRKETGIHWSNMAAFDVLGAAEDYLAKQGGEHLPWEYRMIEVPALDGGAGA